MKTTTTDTSKRSRKRIAIWILIMPVLIVNWYVLMCFLPVDKAGVSTKSEIEMEIEPEVQMETEIELALMTQTSNQTATTTQSNSGGIPKIIHLCWFTARNSTSSSSSENSSIVENAKTFTVPEDGPLPDYVVNNLKRYKELHPDYQVKVWRNTDVVTTFPELINVVKILTVQKKYLSWLSDILRYALLVKFGGIYLDTDFDILRSLEPLRACFPNGFTVCVLPTDKDKLIQPQDIHSAQDLVMPYKCTNMSCQMGAPPQHPVLLKSFEVAMRNTLASFHVVEKGHYPSAFIGGPVIWTNTVHEFNFTTLIGEVFYPCPVQKRGRCKSSDYVNDPYAYAMHKWAASWRKEALKEGSF